VGRAIAWLAAAVVAIASCSLGVDGAEGENFGSGWSAGPGGSDGGTSAAASSEDSVDDADASGSTSAVATSTSGSPDATSQSELTTSASGSDATTSGLAPDTGEQGSTSAADACGTPAVIDSIEALFFDCPGDVGRIGQGDPVPGVTCEEVCCVFGYSRCVAQAAQDVPLFCEPEAPAPVGDCSEVFPNNWTYQCLCE
jgi:hypothetical protein